MMELNNLRAKQVRVGIKNGLTAEDFCARYECTADELLGQLGRIFSRNQKEVKNCLVQMTANAKKARKVVPKEAPQVASGTEEVLPGEANGIAEHEEPTIVAGGEPMASGTTSGEPAISDAADEEPIDDLLAQRMSELDVVKQSEAEQSKQVIDLESSHLELSRQRKVYASEIRSIQDELEQTKELFKQQCERCESKMQEFNELASQMNDISAQLREARVALEETRHKIEELEVLTVFVYKNGDVALDDELATVPSDAETEALYRELLERPECEELKVKEVRTLAKLVTVKRGSPLSVEVVCDNPDLERAYLTLATS